MESSEKFAISDLSAAEGKAMIYPIKSAPLHLLKLAVADLLFRKIFTLAKETIPSIRKDKKDIEAYVLKKGPMFSSYRPRYTNVLFFHPFKNHDRYPLALMASKMYSHYLKHDLYHYKKHYLMPCLSGMGYMRDGILNHLFIYRTTTDGKETADKILKMLETVSKLLTLSSKTEETKKEIIALTFMLGSNVILLGEQMGKKLFHFLNNSGISLPEQFDYRIEFFDQLPLLSEVERGIDDETIEDDFLEVAGL